VHWFDAYIVSIIRVVQMLGRGRRGAPQSENLWVILNQRLDLIQRPAAAGKRPRECLKNGFARDERAW
jgi:hypothetical protein